MRRAPILPVVVLACACAAGAAAEVRLSPADVSSAFKAAGYQLKGTKWIACAEGQLSEVRDINGDGLSDAVIIENGTECHGMTGQGFSLVSKQAGGQWKLLWQGSGIPVFLPGKAAGGWPDLQIGGPGFCFPVYRWSGQKYTRHRFEYEGRRCKP